MSRVTVAGALHQDVIVRAARMPRPDETLMGDAVRYDLGGKAGNQALAAARMNAPVSLLARLGQDAAGTAMRATLDRAGIALDLLQTDPGPSGMSVAILDGDGAYGAVVVSAANRNLLAAALPADTAVLCLQNEVPEAVNRALAAQARGLGARVLLNAAPARPLAPALRQLTDVLIVNRVEAADLTGTADPEAAATALAATGPGAVIVTLGGDGLWLASDGPPRHLPALPVQVVSSHGAGDAFAGALAALLAQGAPLLAALDAARAAAALHVSLPVADRAGLTPATVAAFQARMR
jgi:ribokinase